MKKPVSQTLGAAAIALGAGTLLALVPAIAASAHVSASATSTVAGSSSVVTFSVPHGCEGSPTLQVRIDIPESVPSVSPLVKAEWSVEKTIVELDEPREGGHGEQITERVASVVYTALGEGLPDGYTDTFALSLRLPDGEPGDVVEFPAFQVCADGTAEWVGEDVPSITLTAATDTPPAAEDPEDSRGPGDSQGSGGSEGSGADTLARAFGIGGLVLGAAGVVLALTRARTARS